MRVFFAVRVDGDARAVLAAQAARLAAQVGGRAVAADNLHLTVAFVGSVDAGSGAALEAVGRAVAARVAPFRVTLDRLGRFPRAAVAWAAPAAPPGPLVRAAELATAGCVDAGLPVDRRAYAPHVTLVRRARVDPADTRLRPPVAIAVDDLELMQSVATDTGVVYRPLARFALRVDAA